MHMQLKYATDWMNINSGDLNFFFNKKKASEVFTNKNEN